MPEAKHMQSEGMAADINNNLSERLQGTFRQRLKTLRCIESRTTGQRYLDGWVLTYNHFKGHESLRDDTPGQRAEVNPTVQGVGRRGKSRGRVSPGSEGGDAASLAVEIEIATAGSRPRTRGQGKKAAKASRTRGRKKAKARKPRPAKGAQANAPQGVRESAEAEDRAAVGAQPAPAATASQHALDFTGSG